MSLGLKESQKIVQKLLESGELSEANYKQALYRQEERNTPVLDELVQIGAVTWDQVFRILCAQLGVKVIASIEELTPDPKLLEKVPYAFARKHQLLPLYEKEGKVWVAISHPLNLAPLEELRLTLKTGVEAAYCREDLLKNALHDCYEKGQKSASEIMDTLKEKREEGGGEAEVYDLLDREKEQAPIVKFLNSIFIEAIQQRASDIHFEPGEKGLGVRYRIDGVLQKRHTPPREYQAQLITRIKVMAKMDIAERRLPQDSRIKLQLGAREIDLRVSTVPTVNGERIVLRILDKGSVVLGLDRLEMPAQVDKEFRRLIRMPEGIILVTGPTGSGKTTTLYSAISETQSDDTNIMTVEDPVEYKLPGIAQIGIRGQIGLTFAKGLRHILRQDPDVIMIGEIRDLETAEIAIQASLTGHLVMSTLHTNDAPSAVTRLVDMGVEPYLLSSTLLGVVAQRLARRICPHCKESYLASQEEMDDMGWKGQPLLTLYRGKGCDRCYGSGYSGRQGIYELMPVGGAIQRQIVHSPDAVEMRRVALECGMSTLKDHGSDLVKRGITTTTEILRVTRSSAL